MTYELDLPNPAATLALGRLLGETARRGDVLLMSGDLGAGKTTLSQGLAAGLGVEDPVTSPTFTLLNEYRGRLAFYHLDLYRLTAPEIASQGLAEYWEEPRGVVAIEWPERLAGPLVPESYVAIALSLAPGSGRRAALRAEGPEAARWLSEVQALAARH